MTWGGLGSRGGHVIGTTRSGKAVYQRGGGTRGWSMYDHHDAAGMHDAAGNRATADAHRSAARAIRERRRHGGVLHRMRTAAQTMFDTGPLQTDLLASRALLFSRVWRKSGGGMPATPTAPAAPKAPTASPAPAPTAPKLPQDHPRYFHTEQAHATVPLHQLRPTKTVAQEKGGKSIDNASRAMHAAYHAGGGKRAPISVRKQADGSHAIVDGNATYHAAVRHGWTSLPVRFEKARMVKGASFAAPGPARGEHVLGKTKSGKPVFASGAKAGGFSDDDHVDAATLHARAAAYHESHAADHAKIRDSDRDWKRSEQHHGEHDRHAKLRDHHFERVQDHLVAAGRAEEGEFDGKGIVNRRPVDAKRRAKTKDDLRRRTQYDHPGGHDEADMAEYAGYAAPVKKRMAS